MKKHLFLGALIVFATIQALASTLNPRDLTELKLANSNELIEVHLRSVDLENNTVMLVYNMRERVVPLERFDPKSVELIINTLYQVPENTSREFLESLAAIFDSGESDFITVAQLRANIDSKLEPFQEKLLANEISQSEFNAHVRAATPLGALYLLEQVVPTQGIPALSEYVNRRIAEAEDSFKAFWFSLSTPEQLQYINNVSKFMDAATQFMGRVSREFQVPPFLNSHARSRDFDLLRVLRQEAYQDRHFYLETLNLGPLNELLKQLAAFKLTTFPYDSHNVAAVYIKYFGQFAPVSKRAAYFSINPYFINPTDTRRDRRFFFRHSLPISANSDILTREEIQEITEDYKTSPPEFLRDFNLFREADLSRIDDPVFFLDLTLPELNLALLPATHVDAVNARGETLLHIASRAGAAGVVRDLLMRGADPSVASNSKQTALMLTQSPEIVALLMAHPKNDPTAVCSQRHSVLHHLVQHSTADALLQFLTLSNPEDIKADVHKNFYVLFNHLFKADSSFTVQQTTRNPYLNHSLILIDYLIRNNIYPENDFSLNRLMPQQLNSFNLE